MELVLASKMVIDLFIAILLTRYYHIGKQFTDILVQYTVKEETGAHARAVICVDTRQEIIYVQQGKKRVAILMQQFEKLQKIQ